MGDWFKFSLDSVEADVLGLALGVNVRRFPLRIQTGSGDPVRLAKLAGKVHEDLEERRLSVNGELIPYVRGAMELFDNHRVSVAVTGIDGLGENMAALVLTDGRQCAGITQHGGNDELRFALFSDDEFAEVVAGVLPPMAAASGRTLTVHQRQDPELSAMAALRKAEAEYDEEETDAFGNISINSTVMPSDPEPPPREDNSDAERLTELLSGHRLGGGHIIVTGQGRHGERHAARPLSWVDTEDGRHLVQTTIAENGDLTAHYIPADRTMLVGTIRETIGTVY